MAEPTFVFPGDNIPHDKLPRSSNKSVPLKIGPGLRHILPDIITPTVAGELCVDAKKNAIWVEGFGGKYIPTTGDQVLVTVHHSSIDFYHCTITPHAPLAQLPQLAFENASKKSRPMLSVGSLVYARIALANKHMDPELECVNATTGRADGLGELKGGTVFDLSLGMARRLMMPDPVKQGGIVVLEEFAEKIAYEIAVGRNGKIWVDARDVKKTLAIGKAILETDREKLSIDEQKNTVRRWLNYAGL
ncbi:MAG: Hsp70 protein that interacts with Zuo1p [Watsoniomyces obsoletus]|nr:MAG: Hsp70 protein that interacts with Zuo1p [Watsoniomyces obsoletus]